jgi:hypothetical protein
MSPSIDQSPKSLPDHQKDLEDLESRIKSLSQQITGLQRDLVYLEESLRALKGREVPQAPSSTPHLAGLRPESKRRELQGSWILLSILVLSLILAYSGQFVLLRTNPDMRDEGLRQALAGGLLIAGALLFGAFMPRAVHLVPRLEFPIIDPNPPAFPWRNRWTLGWLSASVVLAIAGIALFATVGESPALILIWLVSILSLVMAQIRHMRITGPGILPEERVYLVALGVLLVITLITRVYRLTTLPYNVDGDFASVGLQARALLSGQQDIFTYGWGNIPALGYLPSWLTMSVFGNNLAGLNASGVIEGLFIIVGVYLLGRDLFHLRVGLTAAAFLTISYTHLAASRQSVYLDPVVVLVFAIYFLLVGLREDRGVPLVVSGILTAFCALVYYPGRIAVLIFGFILLYLLLFRRDWLQARWGMILLWVLAVLIAFGPMLAVFVRDLDSFVGRASTSFILNPDMIKHMQGVYRVDTVFDLLLQHARRAVLMFHYYKDTGTQFGFRHPFLDPFTAPLFTLGMGYALFQWRRFGHAMVIAWTVLVVLTGCFLMGDAPNWPRLMILLPPTALLAALALNVIYEQVNGSLERVSSLVKPLVPVAITLCLIVVGVLNWNTYVELKGTYATPRTRIGRYLADQPPSTQAYLISSDFIYNDREFEFLAPERFIGNLTAEQIDGNVASLRESALLILTQEQRLVVEQLQQQFPNSSIEIHTGNTPGEIAFYVFRAD